MVKEHKRLLKSIILLFEMIMWKLPLKLSPTRKRRTQILKPDFELELIRTSKMEPFCKNS